MRHSKLTIDLADVDKLVAALRVGPAPGRGASIVLAGVGHCAEFWQVHVVGLRELAGASVHRAPMFVAAAKRRGYGLVEPVENGPAGVLGNKAQPVGLVEAYRHVVVLL